MCARRRGFTLIELIVLIVVLSTALAGVMLVFQNVVRRSADPQVYKQALAIAEAMLDEVLLASYDAQPGGGTRASFDDVTDYNGFTTAGGMKDMQGAAIPGLAAYNVTVDVVTDATTALSDSGGALPVAESRRVTVTVTVAGQPDMTVRLDGYRLRYAPP
jgi:MSHA pilin protein MshD